MWLPAPRGGQLFFGDLEKKNSTKSKKSCNKFWWYQIFAYLCHADLKKSAPQSPGGGIGRHATLRG